MNISIKYQTLTVAVLSIVTGLIYVLNLYGPTEREVGMWGLISIGLSFIFLSLIMIKQVSFYKVISGFLGSLVIMLQIPPTVLWFLFHGTGISDGTPPSDFIAHFGFSLPHILIIVLVVRLLNTIRGKKNVKTS